MQKEIVTSTQAPAPIGPYSQAVKINGILFVSGQIALDAASGQLLNSSIEEETHQVMKNIEAILTQAGSSWSDIVKTSIFLKDMNNFGTVNQVYGSYFTSDFPARETVEVSRLPKDVNVEISVIAACR